MSIKSGMVVYEVANPIYEPYKALESKIIKCYAKRITIEGIQRLYLVFMQEDLNDENSFAWDLNFSYKNIEEKLSELFKDFVRKD